MERFAFFEIFSRFFRFCSKPLARSRIVVRSRYSHDTIPQGLPAIVHSARRLIVAFRHTRRATLEIGKTIHGVHNVQDERRARRPAAEGKIRPWVLCWTGGILYSRAVAESSPKEDARRNVHFLGDLLHHGILALHGQQRSGQKREIAVLSLERE
ncbi:MAG: hypothetical protein QM757_45075 [Paludibaculum sp.]